MKARSSGASGVVKSIVDLYNGVLARLRGATRYSDALPPAAAPGEPRAARPPIPEQIRAALTELASHWVDEAPPLPWYALALSCWVLTDPGDPDFLLRLARAANYYGDTRLAISVGQRLAAMGRILEANKQLAKAHQNRGDFGRSREHHRLALQAATEREDDANVAYFLLLYAKLCAHYQQRQAWHRTLHEIAHRRLLRCRRTARDDDRVMRWLQISFNSLAKMLYSQHRTLAERYFQRALPPPSSSTDAWVRVMSHLHRERILAELTRGASAHRETVSDSLRVLWGTVGLAHERGNERAWNVRRLQFLEIARCVLEWRTTHEVTDPEPTLAPLLEAHEVERTLDGIEIGATRLSDYRTLASTAYERAMWSSQADRRGEAVPHLEAAHQQLTAAPDWLLGRYFDVVSELGGIYCERRDWSRAEVLYEEAYQYWSMLENSVKSEEDLIEQTLRGGIARPTAQVAITELQVLDTRERRRLLEELRRDYRALLDRGLSLSHQLWRVQRGLLTERYLEGPQRKRLVEYHALSHHLLKIQRLAGDSEEIKSHVEDMLDVVDDMGRAESQPEVLAPLDITGELRRMIDRLARSDRVQVENGAPDAVPLRVLLNPNILRVLLEGVVWNACDAAVRARRSSVRIVVRVGLDDGLACLFIEDDAGDLEFFSRVIDDVNHRRSPASRRGSNGGKGLLALRGYVAGATGVDRAWRVEDRGAGMKRLVIPLSPLCDA